MSGQPVKTHADQNRFRNEYMQTLALQEGINDMNLQANKTYLLTGQLPPQAQLQDTRTNAEKLADIEKMKRSIADDFSPIAEPNIAYTIITKIMESPLNADNSLFRFLAQRAKMIVERWQKELKHGIAGDMNDIERIVEFIKDMYASLQDKFKSTKSYMDGASNIKSRYDILSSDDIDKIDIQLRDIQKTIAISIGHFPANVAPHIDQMLLDIFTELGILRNSLPTSEEIENFLLEINGDFNYNPATLVTSIELKDFYTLLEKLPRYNQMKILGDKAIKYAQLQSWNQLSDIIQRMTQMINLTPAEYQVLTNVGMQIKERGKNIKARNDDIKRRVLELNNNQLDAILTHYNDPTIKDKQAILNHLVGDKNYQLGDLQQQFGVNPPNINGLGLVKKRRGRPRGSGITKVEKPATYVGFGINEINQRKLNDGILKIRRNTRTSFQDMPSKRIGSRLQKVIKTIIGGGMPNFNDLNNLDEEEKEYLHKIVTRSNMEDKLSIPAPSKDQQEKDIHNFEVLKGQIMSGNDSIELVKKFKLLIRKLAKQGLLPKNDVEDIMDALIDLGY